MRSVVIIYYVQKKLYVIALKMMKRRSYGREIYNGFCCMKCPEESFITSEKFMDSPEFKDLEYGTLRMREGNNIIWLYDG
ncbi:hypothetical protein HSX44_02555 [Wolbachia endosymbiont of Onchocerca gibsoni]|uniref:hypothetical protein n=1 Tax=Wolbachia endosymbiont of Onchocerca gibsoni TaxID=118986 RepID=UPI0023D8BA00|nr:hypothetical protein [Wolbachia endosymbiont of Onchocerca gibsoni]MDF0607763.1 hypothetical protein [Wolbachia endosymbiont of Onchocerca gibsoni]